MKFYLPADPNTKINADIDFPEVCRNNWWHDTYIVVKVPKVNTLGVYKVEVTNTNNKISLPADFTINNQTPNPGLCLLNPNNGPVGWPVAANGERFGAAQGTGRVQYYNNKDGAVRGWADKKVETNVPLNSVSGPFRIIDGQGYISNPLPFRVGKCTDNDECESGEECCGGGTYWSGICRTTGTCAHGSPTDCSFGWTFSTVAGDCELDQEKCNIPSPPVGGPNYNCCAPGQCNTFTGKCDDCPDNKPDQCSGDLQCCSTGGCKDSDGDGKTECSDGEACSSYGLSQCSSSYFCPNSPGKCSTYGGGATIETGSCDYSCNNFNVCQTDLCEYRGAIDKCAKKNQTCALPRTVNYTIGAVPATATANCLIYNNQNRWIMAISTSCPAGWTSISGGRCLENNTICSACDIGFECSKETISAVDGICVVRQKLCPVGSTCDSNNKCTKNDSASCECCCRIGFDSEDCCSPLKCEGKCGSDITANTNTYGYCSGCASVGTTQAEHNEACNCLGTSGKFCLVNTANPAGICQDCAQISDAVVCSGQGVGTCCVDAKNGNVCRGGTDPYATGSPSYNYCRYYECQTTNNVGLNVGACGSSPVASSTLPIYETYEECDNKCGDITLPGATCASQSTTTPTCNTDICQALDCLNEDGSGPTPPSSCGVCCCNPSNDKCVAPLKCQANKGNCGSDTNKRGFCCGCSKDSECGDANTVGCGSDACCQARPSVIDPTVPADGTGNLGTGTDKVCRNTLIQATFYQPMQISTFSSNIIVAGEYGADQCPTGTKYLTVAYKPNLLARLVNWLADLPILNKIFVNQAQALTGNFCIVSGTVSGHAQADETTVMEFKLKQVLEANRKYYVIIKGDSDITDAINNGVLSQAGIGLKSVNEEIFNGVNFKGKIWSFTTKPETAANSGICLVNNVAINPSGYLFNTVINDPSDDSGAGDQIIKDSDKIFSATAYYATNQPVVPIENVYNWRWDWWIDDKSVVKFKNGENALDDNPIQTLVAQNVKEANTLLHAKTTIIQDQINQSSTVGRSKENAVAVYVFLCANPWPPYKSDGSWQPWQDESGNCNPVAGGCSATNFALYYCRDAGKAGTADDLPAILSDSVITRGSNLKCSDSKGSCVGKVKDQSCGTGIICSDVGGSCLNKVKGDACGNGICEDIVCKVDILKEFYFFREGLPSAVGINLATTTNEEIKKGGKVGLVWGEVDNAQKYTIYYGTSAATSSLTQSITATTNGTVANPILVSNLINGIKYYFTVTATYSTGAESDYFIKTTAIPADIWAPITPKEFTGLSDEASTTVRWLANKDDASINYIDDTALYKVYYGANKDADNKVIWGASVSLDKNKCVSGICKMIISNLNSGTVYYFAVTATDSYKNESNKSDPAISLTIK